jgi:hypothetical protein
LPPARQRALQLGLLHADSCGLIEIAAGWRSYGKLVIYTRSPRYPRRRAAHFLAGGGAGERDWLEKLLALVEQHASRGDEVFTAVAVRSEGSPEKDAVAHTRALWVDVDRPGQLHRLWAFLAERPCHLLVASGGSGGAHAYWKLNQPLPGTSTIAATGEIVEPIERANLRLIHNLGTDADGKPSVADPACAERSRVMRLAGTINGKTGAHARILEADLALPAYSIEELVGDLPDPGPPTRARTSPVRHSPDPYKRIPPPTYFEALVGIVVPPRGGLVRCPAPWHADEEPSCSVSVDPQHGWCCHGGSCLARGAIYDLASVLLGGPWGRELRGEHFKNAREYVADVFGELT